MNSPAARLAAVLGTKIEEQGKSILGLSHSTGIAYTTLYRRLNGRSDLTMSELAALAAELGTTASALMAEAEVAA